MSRLNPAREKVRDVVGIADDDQAAGAGMDDVVDALAQGAARRDDVKRSEKPGILTFRQLVKLIPW